MLNLNEFVLKLGKHTISSFIKNKSKCITNEMDVLVYFYINN